MPVDTSSVRWINNGEPLDAEVLNRPIEDLAEAIPDGTVSIRGLLQLASVSEARAGIDNTKAVTPAGLSAAISDAIGSLPDPTPPSEGGGGVVQLQPNGYFIDPSGLIIQWGSTPSSAGGANSIQSQTFPLTFPGAVFIVCVGTLTSRDVAAGSQTMAQLISTTTSGFDWFADALEAGARHRVGIHWIAIGQ